jgi:hypothetical protein
MEVRIPSESNSEEEKPDVISLLPIKWKNVDWFKRKK